MKTSLKSAFLALAASCLLMISCSKDDKDIEVITRSSFPLSGDQEVPAKTSDATGNAKISYNHSTKVMRFTVDWSSLTSNPIGMHIHGTTVRGASAGVKSDFSISFPQTTSGTYSGSITVDGINIKKDSLLDRFYYMDIHTSNNPDGEIRGQIIFQ